MNDIDCDKLLNDVALTLKHIVSNVLNSDKSPTSLQVVEKILVTKSTLLVLPSGILDLPQLVLVILAMNILNHFKRTLL